ncbi:MAG: carbamoyl-phosphate synthase large subunit [Candidatus Tokpelaia sp. JSC161]|jgi:carbamoyl-phosphate synthase large subunit|nr:MAG: carbamoyl-phosphate synthase large subunit [Candidatus Tokpelaia sp. JSC161]
MPKRVDIQSILIIGAGPIIIGQACEFDYSGTQACRALKEEGYRVILVNSNPATIMTDPDLADATYIEPITPEVVSKIIAHERPDALLPTMGGQTALNTASSLKRMGILDRYNVEMIGANAEAIDKAEDRALFREAMKKIGLETPRSMLANATEIKEEDRIHHEKALGLLKEELIGERLDKALDAFETKWQLGGGDRKQRYVAHAIAQARKALDYVGLPAIIRPSFTLGGTGGGIAYNRSQFYEIVEQGLDASPTTEVLIEESVLGWKEYEMEVVRDKKDNCIIVCSIENIDPMGVHTGDSITVAPALTLTDKEYQRMRNAAIAVLREIGVETGGSNVQFAVNPESGRLTIIEMNPRVSRSSALASKATGFPIARIAAKLAVGYTLDELDMTGGRIPAAFEPSIDYIVTKIPRFAFEKFPGSSSVLTTCMKSVGEVMAIGRTFQESLQKALRALEIGLSGLDDITIPEYAEGDERNAVCAAIATPTPDRLRYVAQAMRMGLLVAEIHKISGIDPWFLEQIAGIIQIEEHIRINGLTDNAEDLRILKSMGFSDARLSSLTGSSVEDIAALRHHLDVKPVFKRIDSCAAEFSSETAYMYSTYEMPFSDQTPVPHCEAEVSDNRKVVILGGGPNRIGQGIEFDYCCCHAAFALRDRGYESIMINCNPETVSTDYDTSDRLYFEPLTVEDVFAVLEIERERGQLIGVIVQFGGQTALKLAGALEKAGIPILGTSSDTIDLAEDRDRFQKLLKKLHMIQPRNGVAHSVEQARLVAADLGFPLVVRPSYVLGGRAMQIIRDERALQKYLLESLPELLSEDIKTRYPNDKTGQINTLLGKNPLLFDIYLTDAIEVDVDCLCDGKETIIAGIMEHIEEAGIHSGDSACSLPVHTLPSSIVQKLEEQTFTLARALQVGGLMNVQYAIKDAIVYVLEVNPRASRTVPFVAKTIGKPIAKIATCIMIGLTLDEAFNNYGGYPISEPACIAIKEAVFPFARFPGVDILLGPEMRSTGEVMGLDYDYALAFAKAQIGAGVDLPRQGTLFVSVRDEDKERVLRPVKRLASLGFNILATSGTQIFLTQNGIKASRINKVFEGHPHVEDAIRNRQIHIVFNTVDSATSVSDSKSIRLAALLQKVPYYTTLSGTEAVAEAIEALNAGSLQVYPLQKYFL